MSANVSRSYVALHAAKSLLLVATAAVASICTFNAVASAQNPIVNSQIATSSTYDPYLDEETVYNKKEVTMASALDPYRNVVDPGSFRRVNKYGIDAYGRYYREFGTTWTSFGVPHSRITRVFVQKSYGNSYNPGIVAPPYIGGPVWAGYGGSASGPGAGPVSMSGSPGGFSSPAPSPFPYGPGSVPPGATSSTTGSVYIPGSPGGSPSPGTSAGLIPYGPGTVAPGATPSTKSVWHSTTHSHHAKPYTLPKAK